MSDILLLDTEVESSLRSVVRDLLSTRCDASTVARAYEGDRTLTRTLWTSIVDDLGLAGLLIPEDRGGAGGTARDAAVVLEELGRFVAPVPFLTSSVIATTVLLAGDSALVGQLGDGSRSAALLTPFSTALATRVPALTADADGRVSGRVTSVAGALDADVLLAAVETADGTEVHAVTAAAAAIEPVVSLDMTRPLADVVVDSVPSRVVVAAEFGSRAIQSGLTIGAALLASEQAGVAAWCLETTVEYLKLRRQFGRVVGGFQALKHRLADLYVEVESASAAARYAAGTFAADDPDSVIATAVAASYCSDVAVRAAEEAVQLHGGIGMTWEHPAHLYLKRAKADQIGLGSPGHHRGLLADLVGLPSEEA
ncbi:acyl-CoA dehydrogenase family protein [Nocardia beijingensis]|uniref:acyl-CoA dehydrogenase family protein n=1 Tax=Nocardia beijingensis TaxID=95162 RepID=UPI001893D7C2|nr:acyl-CoA dehydrogenase family protein [Nocardia beijingensis]MBF6076668.1 acyl-CoA/acyl-ACP dehydrogenase [Nocardia beijingensis]